MLNGASGSTAATVSTSAVTSATTGRQVEQQLQVQQPQPQQFRQLFNICRLFLRFNHRFCVFCNSWATATSDSVITCCCSVTAAQSLQDASFQPLQVAVRQPERGFYDFSHFFNNWRANSRFGTAATGTSVTIGCTCTSSCSRALQPVHLADVQLDSGSRLCQGQFRRRARYGQRHWRLGWISSSR